MHDHSAQRSAGHYQSPGDAKAISIRTDRRGFVSGLASAGLGAWASGFGRLMSVFAPIAPIPVPAKRSLINVHHHFVPPFYYSANHERIAAVAGGRMHPPYANWTSEQALAAMDKESVAIAVLSLTTPGVWFGDTHEAAQTARRINEYAADLVRSHPGRFGMFAVIPLPDIESSLHEIEYAFSALTTDGIGLMTSYSDKYLGDPIYQPVMEELNRRRRSCSCILPQGGAVARCCQTSIPSCSRFLKTRLGR